jgi:hypothetical protein
MLLHRGVFILLRRHAPFGEYFTKGDTVL